MCFWIQLKIFPSLYCPVNLSRWNTVLFYDSMRQYSCNIAMKKVEDSIVNP
jgi:hypothetical protein